MRSANLTFSRLAGKIPLHFHLFLFLSLVDFIYFLYLLASGGLRIDPGIRMWAWDVGFWQWYHAFGPLLWFLPILSPGGKTLGREFANFLADMGGALKAAGGTANGKGLVIPVLCLAALVLMSATLINTDSQRAQLLVEPELILAPFDAGFPMVLSLMLSKLLPVDMVSVSIEAVSALVFLAFLAWLSPGRPGLLLPAFFALVIFQDRFLFYVSLSVYEFSSAVFGTLGLYCLVKRYPNVAVTLLAVSCLFRVPGLYFMLAGALVFAWQASTGRARWREINFPYVALLGLATLYDYAGAYYFFFISYDAAYFLTSDKLAGGVAPYLYSVVFFAMMLGTNHAPLLALAGIGAVKGVADRQSPIRPLLWLLALIFVLRCSSPREFVGYYILMFFPLLAGIAYLGLERVLGPGRRLAAGWRRGGLAAVVCLALLQAGWTVRGWAEHPGNKLTGDLGALLAAVSDVLPRQSLIAQRWIKFNAHLPGAREKDFGFWYYPADRGATLGRLGNALGARPCVLFVIPAAKRVTAPGELARLGMVPLTELKGFRRFKVDAWRFHLGGRCLAGLRAGGWQ